MGLVYFLAASGGSGLLLKNMVLFILFILAQNNMNLFFTTFFSKSKFAGELTLFINVILYLSLPLYLIFNWESYFKSYSSYANGN